MNLINNAVDQYGLKTVIGAAVVVGILSYPIIKKISHVALEIFSKCVSWINDTTFLIRFRSLGCDECASHHRHHIEEAILHPQPPV